MLQLFSHNNCCHIFCLSAFSENRNVVDDHVSTDSQIDSLSLNAQVLLVEGLQVGWSGLGCLRGEMKR